VDKTMIVALGVRGLALLVGLLRIVPAANYSGQ